MNRPAPTRQHARGVTLVELMIAMVIGVGLLLGVFKVFQDSKNAYTVSETAARLQETARYALSVIEPDVRMAAYWGLYKGSAGIGGAVAQTAAQSAIGGQSATRCGTNFSLDLANAVEGSNDAYTLKCQAYNNRPVTTADTLTVRRGASIPTTVAAGTVGPLRVCATRTSAQVVNTAPVASCPLAPTGVVSDLYVNTYYVAQDSAAQRNFPALRVLSLTGPTVVAPDFVDSEVISGVEDLQVQFGIDPTGTTCAAAQYVDAFPAAGWPANSTAQIVSVRIWVLVRADSLEPGFTDNTIYQYGNRSTATGIVNNLNNGGAAGSAYQPNDGYRRLLVARTLTLRDARGC